MSTDSQRIPPGSLPRPLREAIAALLLDQRLAMVVTDPLLADNPIVHASRGFCDLTGYAEQEVLGRNCRFLQGPATDVTAIERVRAAVRDGRPISVDIVNYRKNGEPFGSRIHIDPLQVDGRPPYFVGVQQEVPLIGTAGQDGRDIVLRDLRHRLNGTMQLVTSLLRLRMRHTQAAEAVEALGEALEQLEAVMLVQRRLDGIDRAAVVDAGPMIEDLARSLVAAFPGDIAVETRCASVPLPAAQLEPLLLLANEAVINALRHGFRENRPGRLLVALAPAGDGAFELLIADDGIGAAAGDLDRGGIGTMLMRGFTRQLGGTLELTGENGVRVRLEVPAARA